MNYQPQLVRDFWTINSITELQKTWNWITTLQDLSAADKKKIQDAVKKVEVPLVFWTTADCLTKAAGYRRHVFFCMQSSKFSFLLPLIFNSSSLSIYPYAAGGSKAQTSNEDCGADVTDARGRNFGKIPCCCDEGPDGFQQRNSLAPVQEVHHGFSHWSSNCIQSGHPNSCKRPGALFGPSRTKKRMSVNQATNRKL